jgi:predicted AAA+ superfamily ATPase
MLNLSKAFRSRAREKIEREALEWAPTRGSQSGRTAWQFIQDLAGRSGKAVGPHFVPAPADRCNDPYTT